MALGIARVRYVYESIQRGGDSLAKVLVHSDGAVTFECPGCGERHAINTNQKHRWAFNGDVDKPTFSPSLLVKSGHYVNGRTEGECWCTYNEKHPDKPAPFKCYICHSFVTDGKIQFLSDCTHPLAGQTVEMLDEE